MSLIKKKKRSNKSPKRPGKVLLTNDCTGKQVPGKYVITAGFNIETPHLVEIVPNYTKCNRCQMFLGAKETDLADVLDYNCIECFEMQIEEMAEAKSMLVNPMEIVSKNKRGRK
ncbi:MAG: hypothetical protein HOM71_08390 [Deltaproteobacteria bacterium]|mgnify:FL=1|jgi:hypothetical protein|nr:hypothetical protein [Deltaproteobacteria bacterium]